MMRKKMIPNGIKLAVAISAGLLLSACAVTDSREPRVDPKVNAQWVGRPVTDALGKWGNPVSITPDGDGSNVYLWVWGKSYTYDQYVGTNSQYVGDHADYHSDGSITYAPSYQTSNVYEKRRGDIMCVVKVRADSNGRVMNLQTQEAEGGCGDFYSSAKSSPPDAAEASKAKGYVNRFQAIKTITARYHAICTKTEYVALFAQSPCDSKGVTIAGVRNRTQMTPEKTATLAQWYEDMSAILEDYLAFYRSTGELLDKQIADQVDKDRVNDNNNRGFLRREYYLSLRVNAMVSVTQKLYGQYIN